MADVVVGATVSPENRVVLPVEVRRALGIRGGDPVRFVLSGGRVELVTPRQMVAALRANNHGAGPVDGGEAVRAEREADAAADVAGLGRCGPATDDARHEDPQDALARIRAALGLDP